jgi:catechol 2,3-dioxygenase-like lactoylglutathione lyase family enzyme
MEVIGIDHVVLIVADARLSLEWYCDELGLEPLRVDDWEAHKAPFPSVRVSPTAIIDLVEGDRSGQNVDHLCVVVRDDVDELARVGRFDVVEGPADRWGAQGNGRSLYVRDPDDNVIELRNYPDH